MNIITSSHTFPLHAFFHSFSLGNFSLFLVELLDEAQKLFQKAPLHIPSQMAKQMLLRLVIQSQAPADEGNAEEGSPAPTSTAKVPEIGPMRISAVDTIDSIDAAVRVEMKAEGLTFDFSSVYEYFVAANSGRTIARDAPVLNFPMPDQLDIIL